MRQNKIISVLSVLSVPSEEPLQLKLNDMEFITLLATPADIKELFVGFLFTEGIIKKWEDVLCLDECEKEEKKVSIDIEAIVETINPKSAILTSGCGRGVTFQRMIDTMITNPIQVGCELISRLMKEFLSLSKMSRLHAAALADKDGRILIIKEDIGRHNAIDKVLGAGLIKRIDFEDKLLLTTGRLSSEMVLKASRAKIPVVVARSYATSLAVKWASMAGMTIIGEIKADSMSVYSQQERIVND